MWLWRVPSPMPPLPGKKALLGVIKGHWWFHASNLSIWPYSWGWHCGGYPAVSMISWVRKKSVWLEWCWRDVEKWLTLLWSGGEMVVLLLGDGKKTILGPKIWGETVAFILGVCSKGPLTKQLYKAPFETPSHLRHEKTWSKVKDLSRKTLDSFEKEHQFWQAGLKKLTCKTHQPMVFHT